MFDDLIVHIKDKLQNIEPNGFIQNKMSPPEREQLIGLMDLEKVRFASVMILLYPFEGEVLFPLIRRPSYPGVHGGQMALPGGKTEPNEDRVSTAIRETFEEIGVLVKNENILGVLPQLYIPPSNFNVQPVIAWIGQRPEFIPSEFEVEKIIEVDLKNLLSCEIKNKNFVQSQVLSPYYDIYGNEVWGATAMILFEFLTLLNGFNGECLEM